MEDLRCGVCLDPIPANNTGGVVALEPCGHRHHTGCLGQWKSVPKRAECPSCKSLEPGDECSICLVEMDSKPEVSSIKGCGHKFHTGCIANWMNKQMYCPNCLAPFVYLEHGKPGKTDNLVVQLKNITTVFDGVSEKMEKVSDKPGELYKKDPNGVVMLTLQDIQQKLALLRRLLENLEK